MPNTLVLAVGHDPMLLETRSQVLRAAGYTVVSTLSLNKSIVYFLEGDFDLILLCHSIPVAGRERVARLMREHAPRTPIVTVVSYLGENDPFADASIENDPERMVAALREFLQRRDGTTNDGKRLSGGVPAAKLPDRDSGT